MEGWLEQFFYNFFLQIQLLRQENFSYKWTILRWNKIETPSSGILFQTHCHWSINPWIGGLICLRQIFPFFPENSKKVVRFWPNDWIWWRKKVIYTNLYHSGWLKTAVNRNDCNLNFSETLMKIWKVSWNFYANLIFFYSNSHAPSITSDEWISFQQACPNSLHFSIFESNFDRSKRRNLVIWWHVPCKIASRSKLQSVLYWYWCV